MTNPPRLAATPVPSEGQTPFPMEIPPMPEWPAAGQSILPGVVSYLDRNYRVLMGYRPITLDLHVPEGEGPYPTIVYAHPGGFMLGTPVMGQWRPFLERGYAVASIRYRLRSEATHPGPVQDFVAATQWVRTNAEAFNLDASQIFGMGSSAGCYLMNYASLAYGSQGEQWQEGSKNLFKAVVSYYSPTDFLAMAEDAPADIIEQPHTATSSDTLYLGFNPAEHPEEAAKAALSAHVRASAPPVMMFHGDADTRVGVGQAHRFAVALEQAGVEHQLHILPGAGHGTPDFDAPEIVEKAAAFLDAHRSN